MKIAMIGQKGIPSRAGGIEIHVEEIAKRLVNLGCKVDVYCRKAYSGSNKYHKYEGINIKYAPYIRSRSLEAITHSFFSTIKALFAGADIFHYHALGPSTLAFIPKIFGKKVICTVHGLDWQRGKWGGFASRYLKFGEYATAKFSNKTISVSKNLVGYYKEKYNKETYYIPNGVIKPKLLTPNVIRKYGLEEKNYILFLARLVPEKGAHYLINAYKQIVTDKKLVIAGGSSHSDEYQKTLHQLAEGDNRIIFTGFVEGDELAELYSNAYLYILPSDIEGLPISLLEAMSYGSCCLTSDIPENSSVLEDNGFIFKKSDEEDLKLKISYLLKNEGVVELKREKIQSFVLDKYDWENITKETLKLYNEVCHKGGLS